MDLSGKKVAIIGLGKSGQAAARLLATCRARPRVSEQKSGPADENDFIRWTQGKDIPVEYGHSEAFVTDSDLVVISPGVRSDSQAVRWARAKGLPVWAEIELAARFCPCPIIAVTGSNGKTTVTTLIRDILAEGGYHAITAGNIGSPFCERVQELDSHSWAVVEVSSFQLESIVSFKPHVAVFLNFSQNHLDRHKDMEEYFSAKKRIFLNQDKNDFAVLNAGDVKLRALESELHARVVFFNREVEDEDPVGPNPNARAAYRVGRLAGIPDDVCRRVIRDFKGVEHRLEQVRCLQGVDYINDSKATTVEAGRWALERIDRPIVMICGGRDKQIDFTPLRDLVRRKVRQMIVIGEAKDKIMAAFQSEVDMMPQDDLSGAVRAARELARSGDCVLLSPMCASFDMFRNFEERGRIFKELVNRLPE